MILIYLTRYTASPPETAVTRNPVPPLKKEHREFYTDSFSALGAPIARLNRFRRRKNSSNGSDTGVPADWLPPDRGKDGNGHTVTTRHLFSGSCRRKMSNLLPISQPNFDFLGRERKERAEGGGGGRVPRGSGGCLTGKLRENFGDKGRVAS